MRHPVTRLERRQAWALARSRYRRKLRSFCLHGEQPEFKDYWNRGGKQCEAHGNRCAHSLAARHERRQRIKASRRQPPLLNVIVCSPSSSPWHRAPSSVAPINTRGLLSSAQTVGSSTKAGSLPPNPAGLTSLNRATAPTIFGTTSPTLRTSTTPFRSTPPRHTETWTTFSGSLSKPARIPTLVRSPILKRPSSPGVRPRPARLPRWPSSKARTALLHRMHSVRSSRASRRASRSRIIVCLTYRSP